MLKLYIYGYLNRIQSSRRLEREAQRNVELMRLTGRLRPDFLKPLPTFARTTPKGFGGVCRQFVVLCRELGLFADAVVAIDGRQLKAVNNPDRNFTSAKLNGAWRKSNRASIRYLADLDTAVPARTRHSHGARQDSCRLSHAATLLFIPHGDDCLSLGIEGHRGDG